MKKRDIILIIVLTMISVAGIFAVYHNSDAQYADIYVRGTLYGRYDLSEQCSIRLESDNGIINDIEISDGSIRMKDATCPGRECVNCGSISRANQSICCAPAGVLIIIRKEDDAQYDAITQ